MLVKDSVRERAFNDLLKAQKGHSKGKEIVFKELGIQSYLKASSPLTTKEKRFLFSARTRGLDLRNNFKQGKTDLRCRLCRSHLEDQPSLLSCTAIEAGGIEQMNYNDIFSDNLERLTAMTKVLHKKYDNFILHVNRPVVSTNLHGLFADRNIPRTKVLFKSITQVRDRCLGFEK